MALPALRFSKSTLLAVLFVCCAVRPVAAQPVPAQSPQGSASDYITLYRPEVFFGWSRTWLGPSKVDTGPAWSSLGGGIGVRVFRRIGVEFEVNHNVNSALQDVAGIRRGVTSMTVGSVKAIVYLYRGRFQPYVGVGRGLVREGRISPSDCDAGTPPVCDTRPPVAEATYQGAATSAGIRLAIVPRVFLKSEFGGYAGLVQRVSVACGYQF